MQIETGTGRAAASLARQTVAEGVASALREDISMGRLSAGERLRQVEVAHRFGVSTTPVREAFAALQREGLVSIDPRRGATVFVPRAEDLLEHYEIRIALEALAAEKAAERFRPEDGPPLESLLDEMRATTDTTRYIELNHRFHADLYALSGRERLVLMIRGLRDASNAYLYINASSAPAPERLDREHREILAACRARDPERAARAVRVHLRGTVEHVAEELARRPS